MTKSELYQLMADPRQVESKHIPALEQLVVAYPYVASFVYLYLYALAKSEDVRYHAELKRLALYLPSPDALYALIHGWSRPIASDVQEDAQSDSFALIDSYLEVQQSLGEDLPQELRFGGAEGGDYFAESEALDDTTNSIDLLQSEKSTPTSLIAEVRETQEDDEQELFTETLAKIYIQQGKYERALRIIEKLYLHYPQKNRYFADQIRFLQRLVENSKENQEQ